MPCSHVIAACSTVRQDTFLHLFVVYKVVNSFGVYNNSFPVGEKYKYWPTYQGDVIWHNENMRRKKRDRPNNMRIRTKMDMANKLERKCGI